MRKNFRLVSVVISTMALLGTISVATVIAGDDAVIKEGKKIALDRKKGNCLACHMITGEEQPGNIGPPLIVMKARFPDKSALKAQISDPRTKNPNSSMPPFGAHGILTDEELDKLTEYIHSL